MSSRRLWLISVPVAALAWAAIVFFTAVQAPSPMAYLIFLPLLILAVTMTAAPGVWLLARGLRLPGTGERPGLALRAAAWVGLWVAIAAGLQLNGYFSWAPVLTLAVVLGLVEAYLLQIGRQRK